MTSVVYKHIVPEKKRVCCVVCSISDFQSKSRKDKCIETESRLVAVWSQGQGSVEGVRVCGDQLIWNGYTSQ